MNDREKMSPSGEKDVKTKDSRMLSYRWIIFGILAMAYLLVVFHRMSTAVMSSDLMSDFQIDSVALGVLGSMYFYPYALMQIPAGILSDTIGPRKLVTVSFIAAGMGAFLFSVAPTFYWAVAGRFLIGLGVSCVYVPTLKIMAVWFRRNEFATLSGFLGALGALGALIAAAPLAAAMNTIGWRLTIGIIGILTLVMAIAAHFFVRNHPSEIGYRTIDEIDGIPVETTSVKDETSVLQNLKTVFSNIYLWPLLVRGFVFAGVGLGLQSLWGGPYLMSIIGLSRVQAGSLLMMISIGSLITSPIGGYLSDKVIKSRKIVNFTSALLTTICWIPLAIMPEKLTVSALYVLFLCMGIAGGLGLGSVGVAQVKELFPAKLTGAVSGVNNFFQMSGGAIYQILIGMIIAQNSMQDGSYTAEAFKAAFGFMLASVIVGTIAISLSKETMPREKRKVAIRQS
jgi:sugar phosphate permease